MVPDQGGPDTGIEAIDGSGVMAEVGWAATPGCSDGTGVAPPPGPPIRMWSTHTAVDVPPASPRTTTSR